MKKKIIALAALTVLSNLSLTRTASAQADTAYIGQVIYTVLNYCPEGWIEFNGGVHAFSESQVIVAVAGSAFQGNALMDASRTGIINMPNMVGKLIVGGTSPGTSTAGKTAKSGTNALPEAYALTVCVNKTGIFPTRP